MDRYRYLGFAFASADFLFEVNQDGLIEFALGASQGAVGRAENELIGKSWREIVAEEDWSVVEAMFSGLDSGRCGPIPIALNDDQRGRRYVGLSACRLPPRSNVSCAVTLTAATPLSARTRLDDDGYQDRADFDALSKTVLAAAATVGDDLDVALVELPGLGSALSSMGPRKGSTLLRRFAGALRAEAYGGAPAARLGQERFAVIRPKGKTPERIQQRLEDAIAADGAEGLSAQARILAIEPGLGSMDRSLRAMRFAVESFSDHGASGLAGANLNEAFTRSVQRTLAEAGEFGQVIKTRKFNLVFMPIVSLANGECRHFETLVRFEGDTSPYKLIRLAEELDLILELDLAIVEQTLQTIKAIGPRAPTLAVNVSGRSIVDPWYLGELRRMRDDYAVDPASVVLEITESAEIEDLALADRNIQTLRHDGHLVCLDDFGAGSSSYGYLQKLHVDVVKIDGRYVTQLAQDGRDAAMVRHLVNLCGELGVATVAEMVGTMEVEAAARAAGGGFAPG
ncbi:MAG TPA: EAL domain-containing protein, partial [Caulobacteraceae bacterium]|nr:EAL domain-containing protein [Caulobacteraceae bacterium]